MGKQKKLTREEYAAKFARQMERYYYIPQEGEQIIQCKPPYPDYWFISNKGYLFTAYYKDVRILSDNPTEQGPKNKDGERSEMKWRYRSNVLPGGDVAAWKIMADHFCECPFSGYEDEDKDIHHVEKRTSFKPDEGHLCNSADNLQILPKSLHKELTKFASKTSAEHEMEIEAKMKESGCKQYYAYNLTEALKPFIMQVQAATPNGVVKVMDDSDPNNIKVRAFRIADIKFED